MNTLVVLLSAVSLTFGGVATVDTGTGTPVSFQLPDGTVKVVMVDNTKSDFNLSGSAGIFN